MSNGKWDHMMDQTHIGYTYWQEPPHNNMPAVDTLTLSAGPAVSAAGLATSTTSWGVAVRRLRAAWWPAAADFAKPQLPAFNPYQNTDHYIEIFNRSLTPFSYTIRPGAPWIQLGPRKNMVDKEERIWINVDWSKAPSGHAQAPLVIAGPGGGEVRVIVTIDNPATPKSGRFKGFIETNGCMSPSRQNTTPWSHRRIRCKIGIRLQFTGYRRTSPRFASSIGKRSPAWAAPSQA